MAIAHANIWPAPTNVNSPAAAVWVATVNNIGPGLGLVGPSSNYGVLSEFQLWVLSFAMLLGRLELLSVLVLLTSQFWRK